MSVLSIYSRDMISKNYFDFNKWIWTKDFHNSFIYPQNFNILIKISKFCAHLEYAALPVEEISKYDVILTNKFHTFPH